MEQSSGKKERLMLAAGLALALGLAAAQYFYPVSRELWRQEDVRVALLGERSSALLVYHPFSSTVNAFTFTHAKPRRGAANGQRALALASFPAAGAGAEQGPVFFISLSSAPDMDALWASLNNWRSEPRLLFSAAAWAAGLGSSGATDIPVFDIFRLFGEFSKLNSSNFILTEAPRQAQAAPAEPAGETGPDRRVEVFNSSGRKGLAALVARKLRAAGFDVITEASGPALEKHTKILGFSGDTSAAVGLRAALGLEELEIRVRPSQKSVAAAAVVLGEDFDAGAFEK